MQNNYRKEFTPEIFTESNPPNAFEKPWHSRSVEETVEKLKTNVSIGLTKIEARQRLIQHGPNLLEPAHHRSILAILLAQLRSLLVLLLVLASAIAFTMGDTIEAIAILVVIIVNTALGFLTEWKAEQALSALEKQAVLLAYVIRDGAESQIPAQEIVPGDLIVLSAGARVPADGRLVESVQLQIDEAALTGEANAVNKIVNPLPDDDVALGDRLNMTFLGTTISNGRGRFLVTTTGSKTEVGKIGSLINNSSVKTTPLEQKLTYLGRLLIAIVFFLCAIIVLAGWLRGTNDFWHMLEIGLSLAIAAVPEGLPAVVTMTLALGMQRMARNRALVRRLAAVETLGSTTIVCTDKTGTLTENEMTVCAYALSDRAVEVTGAGYATKGQFRDGDNVIEPHTDERLVLALRIGALCNDAKVGFTEGRQTILGDPTEAALIVAAEKAGMRKDSIALEFQRLSEIPFDSSTKRMITVNRTPQGKLVAFVKGAPGTLIATSIAEVGASGVMQLTPGRRSAWNEKNQQLAGVALRVLGLAYRELPENYKKQDLTEGLVLVGLVGMRDPLRSEAKDAIATCRAAGIRIVMITGDQQSTATEIARQLGIDHHPDGRKLRIVHGRELANLDAAGWASIVSDVAVFARVSPEHKLQIVEALQQQGHIVAMTGDGVNDAPALKKADIGIAMGLKGTEVAKDNADMVITDDNFASIVRAIEQGRVIYGNIIRFLHYLLSCNFSEILCVFIALMIGWPLPLVALQILWLNLITDVFPAFALALEPSAPNEMLRPPRNPKESLLTPRIITLIAWQGLLIAGATLVAFGIGMHWHGNQGEGLRQATTMPFMTLALAQVFHAFSVRSQTHSAFTHHLFTNGWLWGAVGICLMLQAAAVYLPLLQRVLHTVPPTLADWGVIAICSLFPVAVVELTKTIRRVTGRVRSTTFAKRI
jgi:Ca2+-transporting ATPase